jgi:hypothetical protein
MALNGTMVAIQTVTVGSGGAANITFSNIPQTYTDLQILVSARTGNSSVTDGLIVTPNGSTTGFSWRRLFGDGTGASSGSSTSNLEVGLINGATSTASTFANSSVYIPNYTGSTNKSFSGDSVSETNGTTSYQSFYATLWSNTAAITSLVLTTGSGQNFSQHTTATLYGISRTTAQIKATGGMVYDTDTHIYHIFNTSGIFTPIQNLTAEYLVIAGGGGGGRGPGAGGGGAGGYRSSVVGELSGGGVSAESALSLIANTNYTVTIGAGGAGASGGIYEQKSGTVGSNSVFSSITSNGGGGGGANSTTQVATTGGSGGGGGPNTTAGVSGTANQGYAGGHMNSYTNGGAGGGGAGSVGVTASINDNRGWNGGSGVTSSITGTAVTRAGGGGGGADNVSPTFQTTNGLGQAGGGNGAHNTTAGSATANSGSGGGGGGRNGNDGTLMTAGSGGSGVIIVRYAK